MENYAKVTHLCVTRKGGSMKLLIAVMALVLIMSSVVMADVTKEDLQKQRQGYVDEIKKADAQLQQLKAEMESKQNMIQRLAGAITALDEALVEKPMGDVEALNKELVENQ
jgi:peptidoglycan hydrolase CwlO-like protein